MGNFRTGVKEVSKEEMKSELAFLEEKTVCLSDKVWRTLQTRHTEQKNGTESRIWKTAEYGRAQKV